MHCLYTVNIVTGILVLATRVLFCRIPLSRTLFLSLALHWTYLSIFFPFITDSIDLPIFANSFRKYMNHSGGIAPNVELLLHVIAYDPIEQRTQMIRTFHFKWFRTNERWVVIIIMYIIHFGAVIVFWNGFVRAFHTIAQQNMTKFRCFVQHGQVEE